MIEAMDRPKEASPRGRGQKLWAILLVLDSFFVIIFGGALAAKLYQHWQAPPAAPRRAARPVKKPEPRPAETAKADAAKPPEAPAPAKQAPTPRSEPAPDPHSPRPPKPSMLHEAPRREAARPQGSAPAAPAASPTAVVKAVPVEFHYKGQARSVELVGAFIVRGGRKAMVESAAGSWTLTLYLTPNTYRYHFVVNGKKVLDPANPRQERGMSVISVTPPAP